MRGRLRVGKISRMMGGEDVSGELKVVREDERNETHMNLG